MKSRKGIVLVTLCLCMTMLICCANGSSDTSSVANPSSTQASTADKFQIGSYVTFGRYPQTAEGTDETPIEWLILDRDGNKALLISRYGLDAQPYYTTNAGLSNYTGYTGYTSSYKGYTGYSSSYNGYTSSYVGYTDYYGYNGYTCTLWENCTLRIWLNDTFLNKAFMNKEQQAIILSEIDNSKKQGYIKWNPHNENSTQDKIFLLSYAEANKYFNVAYNDKDNVKSRVEPTAYAISQGVKTNSDNITADGKAAGYWWLRSPTNVLYSVAYVSTDGSLDLDRVQSVDFCVRPALWVNLDSEIFHSEN